MIFLICILSYEVIKRYNLNIIKFSKRFIDVTYIQQQTHCCYVCIIFTVKLKCKQASFLKIFSKFILPVKLQTFVLDQLIKALKV